MVARFCAARVQEGMAYAACRRRGKGNPGGRIYNRGDGLVEAARNMTGIDQHRLCSTRSVNSAARTHSCACVENVGQLGLWVCGIPAQIFESMSDALQR